MTSILTNSALWLLLAIMCLSTGCHRQAAGTRLATLSSGRILTENKLLTVSNTDMAADSVSTVQPATALSTKEIQHTYSHAGAKSPAAPSQHSPSYSKIQPDSLYPEDSISYRTDMTRWTVGCCLRACLGYYIISTIPTFIYAVVAGAFGFFPLAIAVFVAAFAFLLILVMLWLLKGVDRKFPRRPMPRRRRTPQNGA